MKSGREAGTITRRRRSRGRLVLLAVVVIATHWLIQGATRTDEPMKLPEAVGAWKRTDAPRRVKTAEIFDYMDGAGELYIGYRFDHVDVYDYADQDDNRILAEIYQMETPEDAFGLLSLDWGGEPVTFKAAAPRQASGETAGNHPAARASGLYGAGLLRIWSGDRFARVLAERETLESRKAVLELGELIAAGRQNPPLPRLLTALPGSVASYSLSAGRASFLRSYLVLNSIYYLGAQNILDLGLDCEAVTGLYSQVSSTEKQSIRLLVIQYPDSRRAVEALKRFRAAYLPERSAPFLEDKPEIAQVEDGWMGAQLLGPHLILVFQCPTNTIVPSFLQDSVEALHTMRGEP